MTLPGLPHANPPPSDSTPSAHLTDADDDDDDVAYVVNILSKLFR